MTKNRAAGIWHAAMQCHVISMTYDWVDRRGRLHIKELNCTDMTGCREAFEALDPNVELIEVISGDKPDVAYVRVNGKMEARDLRQLGREG